MGEPVQEILFKTPIRGVSGYATYARELIKAFYNKYSNDYNIQVWNYPWQEYDVPLKNTIEENLICELSDNKVAKDKALLVNWTLPHQFLPDC